MTSLQVDTLTFNFDNEVSAFKYDDWGYYKHHFSKLFPGRKAVDILAFDTDTTFFIEVKDYRQHQRSKTQEICEEIALKVADTLAALFPAKINAKTQAESQAAEQALRRSKICVVFHLELGTSSGTLFSRTLNPANLQIRLRQLLRPIDPHVVVLNMNQCGNYPWSVT